MSFNKLFIPILILAFVLLRYILSAGLAFLICYYPGLRCLRKFKIDPSTPHEKQIKHELTYSLYTVLVFSSVGLFVYWLYESGYTTLYFSPLMYGVPYLIISLVLLICIHDTYFYWTHRLLHTRWFFRNVHSVHHRSKNPTPLAAYSFHPLEALI